MRQRKIPKSGQELAPGIQKDVFRRIETLREKAFGANESEDIRKYYLGREASQSSLERLLSSDNVREKKGTGGKTEKIQERLPAFRNCEAVIFDADCTLWKNTIPFSLFEGIADKLNLSITGSKEGPVKANEVQEVYFIYGNDSKLAAYLMGKSVFLDNKILSLVKGSFSSIPERLMVYTGIEEILNFMKNSCKLRLGILSDAPQKSLDTRMRASGLGKYFEAVESTVSNFCMKPYLGSYLSIAGRLRASPEKTLVIGDSLYADINGAKAMGAPNILAYYGFTDGYQGKNEIRLVGGGDFIQPDLEVHDTSLLLKLFKEMKKS